MGEQRFASCSFFPKLKFQFFFLVIFPDWALHLQHGLTPTRSAGAEAIAQESRGAAASGQAGAELGTGGEPAEGCMPLR